MSARRPTSRELADEIRLRLLDLEALGGFEVLYPDGFLPMNRPHAWAAGPYVMIAFRNDMRSFSLSRERAQVYMAWLRGGGVGDTTACFTTMGGASPVTPRLLPPPTS